MAQGSDSQSSRAGSADQRVRSATASLLAVVQGERDEIAATARDSVSNAVPKMAARDTGLTAFPLRRERAAAGSTAPLPASTAAAPGAPSQPPSKLTGLQREVYQLTGSTAPPLMPEFPVVERKRAPRIRYRIRPVVNAAHPAGAALSLRHWTRVSGLAPDADAAEYPFARFNKRLKTLMYTEEEYARCLARLQPDAPSEPWSRDETDLLFRLCERFDLDFVVIADRWPGRPASAGAAPAARPRTVNELKDRYYTLVRRIMEYRAKTGAPPPRGPLQKHCQAILANAYDVEYENRRKAQLERQYRRSNAEVREEERVSRQAQEILLERKRRDRERARMERLLGVRWGENGEATAEPPAAPSEGEAAAPERPRRPRPAGRGDSVPVRSESMRRPKPLTPGPMARSSLMLAPITQSQRLQRRVDQLLDELGVGIRPTPTADICEQFDALRGDILRLLETQRLVRRKEEEVRQLQSRLEGLERARS